MAAYMVDTYILRYDLKEERPWFVLNYKARGKKKTVNWMPPAENAVFLSDMLRNEKPVYYVESHGKKYLTTSYEPVGEEES